MDQLIAALPPTPAVNTPRMVGMRQQYFDSIPNQQMQPPDGRAMAMQEGGKLLNALAPFLPVTGELDAGFAFVDEGQGFLDSIGAGQYGDAAGHFGLMGLNALGMLPFVGAVGKGAKAAGKASREALEAALKKELKGSPNASTYASKLLLDGADGVADDALAALSAGKSVKHKHAILDDYIGQAQAKHSAWLDEQPASIQWEKGGAGRQADMALKLLEGKGFARQGGRVSPSGGGFSHYLEAPDGRRVRLADHPRSHFRSQQFGGDDFIIDHTGAHYRGAPVDSFELLTKAIDESMEHAAKKLDMSEAARMQRAREMGFLTHGDIERLVQEAAARDVAKAGTVKPRVRAVVDDAIKQGSHGGDLDLYLSNDQDIYNKATRAGLLDADGMAVEGAVPPGYAEARKWQLDAQNRVPKDFQAAAMQNIREPIAEVNEALDPSNWWKGVAKDEPFQVYHGTPEDVKAFNVDKYGGHGAGGNSAKQAVFTTNNPGEASAYAQNIATESPRAARLQKKIRPKVQEAQLALDEASGAYDWGVKDYLSSLKFGDASPEDQAFFVRKIKEYAAPQGAAIDSYSDAMRFAANLDKADELDLISSAHARFLYETDKGAGLSRAKRAAEDAYSRQKKRFDRLGDVKPQPNVMPLHVRAENPYVVNKHGTGMGDITAIMDEAKEAGHDAVIYYDIKDPRPDSTHIAVFNPNQLRSKWAAFDPSKKNSSDLLASFTGLGMTGLLAREIYNSMETPAQ